MIKHVVFFSLELTEPIAFAKQPGNISDMSSVLNAIKQVKCLGLIKPMLVMGNGYFSEKNILTCINQNQKFLVIAGNDPKWIRDEIDSMMPEMENTGSICQFDSMVSGASSTIMHAFSAKVSRAAGSGSKDIRKRLYIYAFKNESIAQSRNTAFTEDLFGLKKLVEDGETDLTDAARKKVDKYLAVSKVGSGGKLKVSYNEEAIRKERRYFGYFALVSNQKMDTFEALKHYRTREKAEDHFDELKEHADGRRPRVWCPDNLKGRTFVQFVNMGYHFFFDRKVNEVMKKLEGKSEGKTEERIGQEKKLLSWLKSRSLLQIMDWFDCIETTRVKTQSGIIRWETETTSRDRLFLELIGMKPE